MLASRLLTDPSEELKDALWQLIFKNNQPRWERLQELLEKAQSTSDYDSSLAVDQLLDYFASSQGAQVRDIFVNQSIDIIDEIGNEAIEYMLSVGPQLSLSDIGSSIVGSIQNIRLYSNSNSSSNSLTVFESIIPSLIKSIQDQAYIKETPSQKLISASKLIQLIQSSGDLSSSFVVDIMRKISKKPVLVDSVSKITSSLLEKTTSRIINKFF